MPKALKPVSHTSSEKVESHLPQYSEIYMTEGTYCMYSLSDLMDVIKLDRFKDLKYIAELRDCDDYTWALMGLIKALMPACAVGLCYMDVLKADGSLDYKHAVCCYVSPVGQFLLIEPQNGSVYTPLKDRDKPFLIVM
jgi:hypothetical protein